MSSPAGTRLSIDRPFVLIDDARAGGRALLLSEPTDILTTWEPDQVRGLIERLRGSAPREAAGFIGYEAGYGLEPRLLPLAAAPAADDLPLLWFGLFDRAEEVDPEALLPDPAGAWAGEPQPLVERAEHQCRVEQVRAHILAGDIYQANLTFPAQVPTAGHPLALYAAIRQRAKGGHGALVFTGTHWILSFSPELFFTLEGDRAVARPMKGTAERHADPARDQAAREALAADPKQRAENLMIVDLLRNDLSRVSRPGTVKVPALFEVETYPTVHQLVSAVTAQLEEGRDVVDLILALFPCGSITGAPKIRAMEIIHDLEGVPRGLYTGTIGRIGADGSAAFNVAIRTLVMREGEDGARLGLGSGIVADSQPGPEWRECLAKGAFVTTGRPFDLIETMRHDAREGVVDFDRHIARLGASARALGFRFDRHHARNEVQAAAFGCGETIVRLMLARSGAIAVELRPLPAIPPEPVTVALAPLPVDPRDFRLRHKTSDRAFYRDARVDGAFETLFVEPDGFLTEGSFTSLFVERDGLLLTPPLGRRLLPGILRQRLIDEERAVEAELRPEDLAGSFLIGNAVRGLIQARLVT